MSRWGVGKSKYKVEDIMTEEELHILASDYVKKNILLLCGYEILMESKDSLPDYVIKKGDQLGFVTVYHEVGKRMFYPTVEKWEKKILKEQADRFRAKGYIAIVNIASTDAARKKAWLTLKDDTFEFTCGGLEEI